MWQRLIGWFKLLWDAGEKVNQQSETIAQLQENDHDLVEVVQTLAARVELLQKDNEMLRQQLQHERERQQSGLRELELKLRLQLSEELRRLPPARDE